MVLVIVGTLIVFGGIGFLVVADVRLRIAARGAHRLSTHTMLTLGATLVLILGAFALFYVFENGGTLAGLPWPTRAANALFMAITPRTAGFNTVNYDAVSDPSLVLTLILMFVGGSPGSTAGGIKTTGASFARGKIGAKTRSD